MEHQFPSISPQDPTWLTYAAVLLLAVYFRFSRFFSVRNLDIVLILLLSTALVIAGGRKEDEYSHRFSDVANSSAVLDDVPVTSFAATDSIPESGGSESAAVETATGLETASGSGTAGSDTAAPEQAAVAANAAPISRDNQQAEAEQSAGTPWSNFALLTLSVLLMSRLIFDEALTRRPRLEQNLNYPGMVFLCVPAFVLLSISVFLVEPPKSTVMAVEHGRALLERRVVKVTPEEAADQPPAPTETLLAAGAAGVAQLSENLGSEGRPQADSRQTQFTIAKILVVISHFIVVSGLIYIGKLHFGSLQLGVSMSCLYLLLPCTAYHVHQLNHVLPAACLTWAVACYRKPAMAGVLLGLACGTLFFAVFLLPLWAVFYGRRGSIRFGASLVGVAVILMVCLMMTSSDTTSFMSKIVTTTNWTVYRLLDVNTSLADSGYGQLLIRIPMAALFFVMLTAMTVLPRPRNLESLLANSTVLVVAAQLWYPEDIGMYVLWYLPLLLLVVFRPRLDRFAPPEIVDRVSATASPPKRKPAAAATTVSRMSRMDLYR
jgi:hypothetical protein